MLQQFDAYFIDVDEIISATPEITSIGLGPIAITRVRFKNGNVVDVYGDGTRDLLDKALKEKTK